MPHPATDDELSENSQRRVNILEATARALHREWFVHFRFADHDQPAASVGTAEGCPEGVSASNGANQKFRELTGTFERQAATLQRQIQNLRRTRDLLLPRLLSGQIEVEAA